MDVDIRETKQGRNRCSRDCCGAHWSASTLVEWFFRGFRCVFLFLISPMIFVCPDGLAITVRPCQLLHVLQIRSWHSPHVLPPCPGLSGYYFASCQLFIDCLQYNVFSLIFSWFALANIWLTFSIIIDLLPSQGIIIFGTEEIVSLHRSF